MLGIVLEDENFQRDMRANKGFQRSVFTNMICKEKNMYMTFESLY